MGGSPLHGAWRCWPQRDSDDETYKQLKINKKWCCVAVIFYFILFYFIDWGQNLFAPEFRIPWEISKEKTYTHYLQPCLFFVRNCPTMLFTCLHSLQYFCALCATKIYICTCRHPQREGGGRSAALKIRTNKIVIAQTRTYHGLSVNVGLWNHLPELMTVKWTVFVVLFRRLERGKWQGARGRQRGPNGQPQASTNPNPGVPMKRMARSHWETV